MRLKLSRPLLSPVARAKWGCVLCPLKLMLYGCVARSTDKGSAVIIERYEFRTQGKGARRVEGMELGL